MRPNLVRHLSGTKGNALATDLPRRVDERVVRRREEPEFLEKVRGDQYLARASGPLPRRRRRRTHHEHVESVKVAQIFFDEDPTAVAVGFHRDDQGETDETDGTFAALEVSSVCHTRRRAAPWTIKGAGAKLAHRSGSSVTTSRPWPHQRQVTDSTW